MALTGEQLVFTAEIVRESYASVVTATTALNADQESRLTEEIDLWEKIRNSFIRYGGDGVDFDNERKRAAIFYRVRQMLGFPFITYWLDAEVLQLFELEVGSNFG